jgi:hypothetical protein
MSQSIIQSIIPAIPMFAGVVSFLTMFAVSEEFSSASTFSVLAVYNIMRFMVSLGPTGLKVTRVYTPHLILQASTEALVGLRRLRAFLQLPDRAATYATPPAGLALEFNGVTAAWPIPPKRGTRRVLSCL